MSRPVTALASIALFAAGFGLARAADPDRQSSGPTGVETVAAERAMVVRARPDGAIPPYPSPRKPSAQDQSTGLSIVTPLSSTPTTVTPQAQSLPDTASRPHGITVEP